MAVDMSMQADMSFQPELYDIHRILDIDIVGEHESRMSLFTNWILGEKNVLMSGPRSSGKTWISDHVKAFVGDMELEPNGRCFTLTAGSEKSQWYQLEQIGKADFIIVLELNKIPKEAQEVLKDWGEGKPSKYNTVIFEGGVRKNRRITLPPKPFVFCLADEDEMKVGVQLQSRLTTIRTDATIQQNKRVLNQQAKLAMEPTNVKNVDAQLVQKIKDHINTLPPFNKYEFKHPASTIFSSSIPAFFTDCRRDFPKYLANVSGICRFYWKKRIIKDKFIFITPQDMYLNHIIYGNILVESSLKCSNIERAIIHILKAGGDNPLDKPTIQRELRKNGFNISKGMITRHINTLVDVGYVNKVDNPGSKNLLYTAGEFFNEFSFSIDWKKVIQECVENINKFYPDIADPYIKKYIENPIVKHPFTGEDVDLRNLKVMEIEPSKGNLLAYEKGDKKPKVIPEQLKKYCAKHDKYYDISEGCPDCLSGEKIEVEEEEVL